MRKRCAGQFRTLHSIRAEDFSFLLSFIYSLNNGAKITTQEFPILSGNSLLEIFSVLNHRPDIPL